MTTCWASQAADDYAAAGDEAEKWAEYVDTFMDDAADELMADGERLSDLIHYSGSNAIDALLARTLTTFGDERETALYELRQAVHQVALADSWTKARALELANEAVKQAEEDGVPA